MNTADFLKSILAGLVAFPDQVQIDESKDEMGVLLSLRVAPADMGRIIGRQGMTAKSIRHLLLCHGLTNQSRVSLKILEPTFGI